MKDRHPPDVYAIPEVLAIVLLSDSAGGHMESCAVKATTTSSSNARMVFRASGGRDLSAHGDSLRSKSLRRFSRLSLRQRLASTSRSRHNALIGIWPFRNLNANRWATEPVADYRTMARTVAIAEWPQNGTSPATRPRLQARFRRFARTTSRHWNRQIIQ